MARKATTHVVQDADRTRAGSGGPTVGRVRSSTALAVYDRHGDALFSLALLLCRDVDRAVDAVVATVTQACATASDPMSDARRKSLAADLWHRYASDPGAQASPPGPPPGCLPHPDGQSGEQEQALLGLVLFGCHTYGQAAALIGVSAPSAAVHLRSVLRRAADVRSDRRA